MGSSGRNGQVPPSLGSSVGFRNDGGHCLQDCLRRGWVGGGRQNRPLLAARPETSRPETWPRGAGELPAEAAGFSPFCWCIGVLASRQVLCLDGGCQALSSWVALLLSPTSTPSTNFLFSFLSSLDG